MSPRQLHKAKRRKLLAKNIKKKLLFVEKLFQFSFSLLTEADTRKSTGNEEKPHEPSERQKVLILSATIQQAQII